MMAEQFVDARNFAEALTLAALEGKRNERELRECVREAARLLELVGKVDRDTPEYIDAVEAWLASPAVVSALALEAADAGQL